MARKKSPTKPIDDLYASSVRATAHEDMAAKCPVTTEPERIAKKWSSGMARHYRRQFASRLKLLREQAGLSLNRLADLADMDHSQLVRLESGERTCTLETAIQIACALGVSLGILTDDEPKHKR